MKPRIATLLAGVLFSLALFGVAAAGPLEDGRAAYERSDYATALRLLRPLAEQGSAEAQLRLGWMSQFGQSGTVDEKQAVAWYGKAADQGLPEAQYNLGFMLEGGYGVTKDEAQARKLYRKAADQGHAMSQVIVATFYAIGEDGTRDDLRAYTNSG